MSWQPGIRPWITSIPALATALRQSDTWRPDRPVQDLWARHRLVPMYRIVADTPEEEAQRGVQTLREVADRLRRLQDAYGEWHHFDAGAYFDLSDVQATRLVHIAERVSTVHVIFFADLLFPTFQAVEHYWATCFVPAYRTCQRQLATGHAPREAAAAFFDQIQPAMVRRWEQMLEVMGQARRILGEDIGFMALNGGEDERSRWRRLWRQEPAPGLHPALTGDLSGLPTLTLACTFPLPAYRQPGRVRRLRLNRLRRQRWQGHRRHRNL